MRNIQVEVIHSVDVHSCELDNIIQKICELENVTISDLYIFTSMNMFDDKPQYVKFVEHIPIKNSKLQHEIFLKNVVFSQSERKYLTLLNKFVALNPLQMKEKLLINNIERIHFYKYINHTIDHFSSNLYFVLKKDFRKIMKWSKLAEKESIAKVDPPILEDSMLLDIYENSIGFLLNHKKLKEEYKKFRIPLKRGILLAGLPGSGKTLTCKWLRYLTKKHNFTSKIVDMETYERLKHKGSLETLFKLHKPGIIFFDDMDVMLKSRKTGNTEVVNFLTNLDGITPSEGVVFVFTTNFLEELDDASIRCGRIDLFKKFEAPSESLRKKYITHMYNKELLDLIGEDLDFLVAKTNEYSFAELEEIRKMLAMDFVKEHKVSLKKTLKLFEQHRSDFKNRLGFGLNKEDNEDDEFLDLQRPTYPWKEDEDDDLFK